MSELHTPKIGLALSSEPQKCTGIRIVANNKHIWLPLTVEQYLKLQQFMTDNNVEYEEIK